MRGYETCSKSSDMLTSGVIKGSKGGNLPLGAALWGRQIEARMLRNDHEISDVTGY